MLAAALMWVGTVGGFAGEKLVEWRSGSLTDEDISVYCRAMQYPYADPWATVRKSADPAERADAASFIEQVARERAWERATAARARESSPSLEANVRRISEELFDGCVAAVWRAQTAERYTTPSTERLVEAALARRSRFEREEWREVRYIFRSTTGTRNRQEREAIRRELENVRREIAEGRTSFSEAARLHSEAPSSARGGMLGVIPRSAPFNPKFMEFVFSLPEGALSPPTLLHNGYYVVQVPHVYPAIRLTTETILGDARWQSELLAALRQEFVEEQARALVARHQSPTTSVTANMLAKAALAEMTTPSECAKMELFLRERILARTWFLDAHLATFQPTEAEAREYYTSYSAAMREGGILKYTRFFVPYSTGRFPTRKAALEALERFRAALVESPPGLSEEELQRQAQAHGVEITRTNDWVLATEEQRADDELIRLTTGSLTRTYLLDRGVAFYRLDGRREKPRLTFDEVREFCLWQARNIKAWRALEQAIHRYAEEQHLRILVPLPR